MTVFDLTLQVPPDAGFAPMVRDLALHGARTAGCAEAQCIAFGREVEDAARHVLTGAEGAEGAKGKGARGAKGAEGARGAKSAMVPVAVRCDGGPIEVVIGSGAAARTITLEV